MSGTGSDNGWLEAAIAWEVCASLHRQYCKGKDALFTTRQSDFVKHAENARGRASHGQAPATQQAGEVLSDDLRDRLVAISAAVADQDDRAAQAMLREILKAPRAESQPAPALLSDEELCQIEEPYLLNFRIPLGGQYDFARAVEKAVICKMGKAQAPQGETNVQLDIDSNPSTPGQQRDMAGSLALGQPMGNGPDQVAGHTGAQGDKLLTVAERNIRSFLRSAVFKSESDREAALNCVDVLWAAARSLADSVTAPAGWRVVPEVATIEMIDAALAVDPAHESVWEAYLSKAPTPPAQAADSVLGDAALLRARHEFLLWNRSLQPSPIESSVEYSVFDKALELYDAARAPAESVLEDALNRLLEAATEIVETVECYDPDTLLALDEDPHPPSTINASSDNLKHAIVSIRAAMAANGGNK